MFELPTYTPPDFNQAFLKNAPNAKLVCVEKDGISPVHYHALSVFPEYFKINDRWVLAVQSRMDTVAVAHDEPGQEKVEIVEFRNLKKGDKVVVGRAEDASEGIYVYTHGFESKEEEEQTFAFRSGRSRETAFSKDYDELYEILRHDKDGSGKITWVLGTAAILDPTARRGLARLIREGYVDAIIAGNSFFIYDLEEATRGTMNDQQDFQRDQNTYNNYFDVVNEVRKAGSLATYVKESGKVRDGVTKACVEAGVEMVICGTIRDRFPLPETYNNVYQAQDAMRAQIKQTSTLIMVSAILATIATGNMTPSYNEFDGQIRPVYMYTVDIQEFAVNKLSDRGTLTAKSIVTNAQDFLINISRALAGNQIED